jgi:Nuclease-related domain
MYVLDTDPTARTPGQYARAAVRRLRMRTLVTLGVLAVATALLGRSFGLHDFRFIASELALLITMFLISHYVLPLVERRDRGARGEEQVGALLEALDGEGWLVIHDATFGNGNVDHILIGPPGAFTVETKSHPGPIKVGRLHGSMINQARAQARAIERVTGIQAEPLIVFSRAWVDKPMARRKGVRVMPARMLVGYLQKRSPRLVPAQVDEAHRLLAAELIEHQGRMRLLGERFSLRL